jgi:hypothetical protein
LVLKDCLDISSKVMAGSSSCYEHFPVYSSVDRYYYPVYIHFNIGCEDVIIACLTTEWSTTGLEILVILN